MPQPKIHESATARTKAYRKRQKIKNPEHVKKLNRDSSRRFREKHPEYLQARTARYRRRKVFWISQKGGECYECGLLYSGKNAAAFDFHHRDPKTKGKRGIQSLLTSGTDKDIAVEMEKCDLLCSNCHRIEEYGEF